MPFSPLFIMARKNVGSYLPVPDDPNLVYIALVVSVLFSLYQWYQNIGEAKKNARKAKKYASDSEAMQERSKAQEEKKILKVSDRVYVAVGYSTYNCILIEGTRTRLCPDKN